MAGSSLGRLLVLTTFGESHGPAVGAVLDGLPPGVPIDLGRVQAELDRRRPGASPLTSARREPDRLEVLSGLVEGRTLGTPVCALVRNEDARSGDYRDDAYRPSHADFTYDARYGVRAVAGGGRASARETVGRVLGGAFARQVLETLGPVQIVAWVDRVADLGPAVVDEEAVDQAAVDAQDCRCPDPALASAMTEAILAARKAGDTLGGVIKVVVRGLPAGLGSPVFDKLDARLGAALLSLPAAKGVEVGSGYGGARQTGRAHNDRFIPDPTRGIATATNRSGGVQGGLSNGMPLVATVAFKPVATIFHPQETVDRAGQPVVLRSRGRHDPCVLPRAVVMVEAMVALVLLDEWLCWRGQVGAPPPVPLLRPG